MSEHGACLQTFNQELVKCLEEMKTKRVEITDLITLEEKEEAELQKAIASIQHKLRIVQGKLSHHRQLCDDYDKTIQETENGFKKILESSQTLLNLAQHQSNKLNTLQNEG